MTPVAALKARAASLKCFVTLGCMRSSWANSPSGMDRGSAGDDGGPAPESIPRRSSP